MSSRLPMLSKAHEVTVVALGHMSLTEDRLKVNSSELWAIGYKKVYHDIDRLNGIIDLTKAAVLSDDPETIFEALKELSPILEEIDMRSARYEKMLKDKREAVTKSRGTSSRDHFMTSLPSSGYIR